MSDLEFRQPVLANSYEADPVLRDYLERTLDADARAWAEPKLKEMGDLAVGTLAQLARDAEAYPPVHVPYDAWGNRIDEIRFHPAWHEIGAIAREWGLAAMAYEPQTRQMLGAQARTVEFAIDYLFAPSSATYTCPVAMTDAASRVLELFGLPDLEHAYRRFTSRDDDAWTCGQWMTERAGGSDVGQTSTEARNEDGTWRLHGDKWFCSSVQSEATLTLARLPQGQAGTKGLGLFLVPQWLDDGTRNRIRINRLKDKLGTRALASAECTFEGAEAWPVGDLGAGFAQMTEMLNLTRIHNAIGASSGMRRGLQLARAYAGQRRAFGRLVKDQPLQREMLVTLAVEAEGAFALTFRTIRELGAVESGAGDRRLLRILTPLAKYYTARRAVWAASHVIESFGGPGYIEDTGVPRVLRDAQVLPIWEGTSNVMSLDVLRALARDDAGPALLAELADAAAEGGHPALAHARDVLVRERDEIAADLSWLTTQDLDGAQLAARRLAGRMAEAAIAGELLRSAAWALENKGDARVATVVRLWIERHLAAPEGRGIRSGDRTALDSFAALVDGERLPLR
jgi:alkylation response protein AidB-like acyl-CoA dehydrogenase